jgi:hypothetical protein
MFWTSLQVNMMMMTRHTSHVTRHTSHVTRHSSHLTPSSDALLRLGEPSRGKALLLRSLQAKIDRHGKKSPLVAAAMVRGGGGACVSRHTSHVTRHTSHVTRHTSHVTRLLFQVSIAAVLEAAKAKEFLTKALAILEASYGAA